VEDSVPEEERFIVDLNFNKRSFNIPWMVGVNSEEMLFKTAGKLYYQYIHVNRSNKQCINRCFVLQICFNPKWSTNYI